MAYNNSAYDLSRYEYQPRTEVKQAPQLRVVKTRKKAVAATRPMVIISYLCVGAILIALIAANICNRVALTNLSSDIETANRQLRVLEGDAVRLNSQLESRMSLRTLEETASARLGLGKAERSQITYLNLSGSDKVILSQANNEPSVVKEVYNKVLKLLNLK